MASVGIAFSGGGLPALFSALCALDALNFTGLLPERVITSTTSGGTVGYALWINAGRRLHFPNFSFDVSREEASKQSHTLDRPLWFGKILNPFGALASEAQVTHSGSHWWQHILERAASSYELNFSSLESGSREWLINYATLNKTACPISLASDDTYPLARESLGLEVTDSRSRSASLLHRISDAVAASSAFWAARIVESPWATATSRGMLMEVGDRYLLDGGVVDTSGIVALLRRQVKNIVAFYNDNNDLSALNASIAYLFGLGTVTNDMNSLQGPALSQVFPTNLAFETLNNLTNPELLRAQLSPVPVVDNSYLGVRAYTLSSLLILSNQRSERFLHSFQDASIEAHLSHEYPNQYKIGMAPLGANMLCAYNQWKVRRHENEIRHTLHTGDTLRHFDVSERGSPLHHLVV
eukprot:TRINITY_DN4828_c0_g1_i1.p1 TRINITY_DN4828_c0_g1~~TRINITY_DN4828_c0_g1_i1.p1  ORF type:complete len:412 (+),score=54.40 TRINITY_DN4828_c0_g1_i1:71-1306(+)